MGEDFNAHLCDNFYQIIVKEATRSNLPNILLTNISHTILILNSNCPDQRGVHISEACVSGMSVCTKFRRIL